MAAPGTPPRPVAAGAPRGGLVSLCITQTTGWGLLYYSLPAAVRPISEDTGWDPVLITGSFSAGLPAHRGTHRRRRLAQHFPGPGQVVAGPALAASLGSYTAMAYATAAAAGVAAVIAGFLPRAEAASPDRPQGANRADSAPLARGKTGK